MKYEDLGSEVGKLVDEKNTAYGNSFNVAEDFIKLLWPKGVPPESFNDMLCVVRIFDKLKRIATNKGYGGESPYRDIAGYALLGLMKDELKPKSWKAAELVPEEELTPLADYGLPVIDMELTSRPVVAHKKYKLEGEWKVEPAQPLQAVYGPDVKVEDFVFDYNGIHQPVSKPRKKKKSKNKA